MPNGYGVRPGEYTKVGIESEIEIPWLTYKYVGLIGTIAICGMFVIGWLVWLMVDLPSTSAWSWVSRSWWPWVRRWWPLPFVFIVLWWISIPTFPILYRFTIEQLVKNPPMYGPYNADNGMWHPWVNWRRRRIENAGLRNTYREKFGKKEQEKP